MKKYRYNAKRRGRLTQRFTNISASLILLVNSFSFALPLVLTQRAFAATTITVCDAICDWTNIPDALTAAVDGDTISVSSNQVITSAINVNKDVTITSSTNAVLSTSGIDKVFTLTADGVTISGFSFVKTDAVGEQNFIGVQSNNVTVSANSFNGNWTIGNNYVVRAVLASPNRTNLTISNNNIQNVRQPAYIDGTTTGSITNNHVHNTKGWVIQSSTDLNFSGNTWGTNVLDIAIFAPNATNNYNDAEVVQMSADNNNAVVEHQLGGNRLSDAYVAQVANGNVGDNGSKWNPYTSIQSALNRIVDGGTVHVANGSYSESFTVTKNGTQLIGESKAGVQITSSGATPSGYAVDVTALQNVAIKNMTFNEGSVGANPGYQLKIYQASGVTLENLDLNGLGSSITPRTGGVDLNGTSNVTINNVSVENYSKNGFAVTAKYAAADIASQNYNFSNISSTGNAWHGIAFYTYNGAGTVADSINGVSFGGSNSVSGNGQSGVILAGATDPVIILNGSPSYAVTGPSSAPLNLASFSLASNPLDIINFQTGDVQAIGAVLNGKTGDSMTSSERTAQDAKIIDELDNAALGLVSYYDPLPPCDANVFDIFTNGSVNSQNGWSATGPYDQAVVSNTYGFTSFGCRALRLSNGVASGSFGDHVFSSSVANEAGDTDASNGGVSGGTRQNHFEAQFDIASTQAGQQAGLSLSVSPDRGDGARMSYLRFQDEAAGIDVYFVDVQGVGDPANFVETKITTLDRATAHTIKLTIDFNNGGSNDVVKIYVDGNLTHTGTTWENYFRFDNESNPSLVNESRTVDSLLFRAGGSSVPANLSKGYLFDNVTLSTSTNAVPPAAPSNLRYEGPPVACGGFTNINWTTAAWDNVAGAASYNYEALYNGNVVYNNNFTGTSNTGSFGGGQNGTWAFRVQSVGPTGLTSAWTTVCEITLDTVTPAIPTNLTWTPEGGSTMASGGTTNTQKGTLNWQDSDPSVDRYKYYFWTNIPGYFEGQASAWSTEGTTYISESPTGGSIWTDFYNSEGTYSFCVKAIDVNNNESNCSETYSVTYDKTAPALPVHLSPANNSSQNTNNFWFDWTDATGAVSYEVQFSQSNSTDSNGALNIGVWSGDSNHNQPTESQAWSSGANGTWYWQVRAIDGAGNKSGWTSPWKLTIDLSAPTSTLIFSTPGPSATGFSVQFSEAVKAAEAENSANYFLNNWPGAGGSGDLSGDVSISYDTTTHIATITFLNAGWYISPEQQWGVQDIHDLAGNLMTPNPTTAYSTPLVAPTVPGSPTATSAANNLNVTWLWADSTDLGGSGVKEYHYELSNGSSIVASGTTPTNTVITPVSGDGTYTLTVYATDNAGSPQSASASGSTTIDVTAPIIIINSIADTEDTTPIITGTTDEPSLPVTVIVGGDPYGATVNPDGSWSAQVTSALAAGPYTVTATSTDAAGNAPTPVPSQSFTVLAPAPTSFVAGASTDEPSNPTPPPANRSSRSNSNNSAATETDDAEVLAAETTVAQTNEDTDAEVQAQLNEAKTIATGESQTTGSSCAKFIGLCWYWWVGIIVTVLIIVAILYGNRRDSAGSI